MVPFTVPFSVPFPFSVAAAAFTTVASSFALEILFRVSPGPVSAPPRTSAPALPFDAGARLAAPRALIAAVAAAPRDAPPPPLYSQLQP